MSVLGSSKTGGKKKREAPITDESEWENHWLLRVPESYADRIRAFCETRVPSEQLKIKFDPDQRSGTLDVGKNRLHFTIYDLPCIIEVLKTIDKVNLFKVNNLSQMLLCTEEPQPKLAIQSPPQQPTTSTATKSFEETEVEAAEAQLLKQKREKLYQYPHGILPPLKNVRRRRFRKIKKKKYMDAPEVEKEVKRLLRADLAATKTWYEIDTVDAGQEGSKKTKALPQKDDPFGEAQMDLFGEAQKELEHIPRHHNTETLPPPTHQRDLLDVFGEISSSEDENDDELE